VGFLRAFASDLDGTLTASGTVSVDLLGAIVELRREGIAAVLVTGRTLTDLHTSFPGLASRFDAVVAENGAVLAPGGAPARPLASPVSSALESALVARGVPVTRGEVLLACPAIHASTAVEEISRMGLDNQLYRNRGALMILPAGVSKGTGLIAAVTELGLSPHNAVAVGDAENDLALLDVAEIGVAVPNAVPSLLEHADLVLDRPDGGGVTDLLTGSLLSGEQPFCPPRRWPSIGHFDDGRPTTVPGSQANILIAGSSGAGKSYLAGLLAETWIDAGYRILVIDPEGDHGGLGRLRETIRIDLDDHRIVPGDIAQQLRLASVVLDMSRPTVLDKAGFVRSLLQAIDLARAAHGVPHWVVLDEAQMLFPSPDLPILRQWLTARGYLLVSYQPATLPADILDLVDTTLSVPGHSELDSTAALSDTVRALIAREGTRRAFTAAPRRTPHTRHRHKYADAQLQAERRFYFHTPGRQPPAAAGNLTEFVQQLRRGDYPTLEHHLSRGDFSRWITGTLQDARLGQQIAQIEHEAAAARSLALDRARRHIVHAIETRYRLAPEGANAGPDTPGLNESRTKDRIGGGRCCGR
jgi:hypothetical protein